MDVSIFDNRIFNVSERYLRGDLCRIFMGM